MQQYELSSRDGRMMIRVGRITVDDIPKLNMRLRVERHRVDMPNFGIGKDRHKERISRKLKGLGVVKLELTGLSIEVDSRVGLKKQIQA